MIFKEANSSGGAVELFCHLIGPKSEPFLAAPPLQMLELLLQTNAALAPKALKALPCTGLRYVFDP